MNSKRISSFFASRGRFLFTALKSSHSTARHLFLQSPLFRNSLTPDDDADVQSLHSSSLKTFVPALKGSEQRGRAVVRQTAAASLLCCSSDMTMQLFEKLSLSLSLSLSLCAQVTLVYPSPNQRASSFLEERKRGFSISHRATPKHPPGYGQSFGWHDRAHCFQITPRDPLHTDFQRRSGWVIQTAENIWAIERASGLPPTNGSSIVAAAAAAAIV
jgi:hypothetical protein